MYNSELAKEAQLRYCDEHRLPDFAPHDGICFRCGANIYEPKNGSRAISVEEAGSKLITGCPNCSWSYCD